MKTLVGLDRTLSSVLVDALAVAVAVSLPWSTSATTILVCLWLVALVVAVVPAIDFVLLARVLRTPPGALPALARLTTSALRSHARSADEYRMSSQFRCAGSTIASFTARATNAHGGTRRTSIPCRLHSDFGSRRGAFLKPLVATRSLKTQENRRAVRGEGPGRG